MTQTLPQHLSLSNDWGTPRVWIERVKRVFAGAIDLDPASSAYHQQTVGAEHYYTQQEDGLSRHWYGRVFHNPPYGREQGAWITHLLEEYQHGHVDEAILLVNAATDTAWFQPLWEHLICFVHPRIAFTNPTGTKSRPTHANVFVYIGKAHVLDFAKAFTGESIGHVVFPDSHRIYTMLMENHHAF